MGLELVGSNKSLENDEESIDSFAEGDLAEDSSREPMLPRRRSSARSRLNGLNALAGILRTLHKYPAYRAIRWLWIAFFCSLVLLGTGLWRWQAVKETRRLAAIKSASEGPPWKKFSFLERYYGGMRTLVPTTLNSSEYPADGDAEDVVFGKHMISNFPSELVKIELDPSQEVRECFLDEDTKQTIPPVEMFSGLPDGFPRPVMGSYELLDMPLTCHERVGRLAPYGYVEPVDERKTGLQDKETNEPRSVMDYSQAKWGEAQQRCVEKNAHRFKTKTEEPAYGKLWTMHSELGTEDKKTTADSESQKLPRTAIILRTWRDYHYSEEVILNLRSMIAELSLASGGQYSVHFLIHVKDPALPIWSDEAVYNQTLAEALPEEFAGMGTLWSESQSAVLYPGLKDGNKQLPASGVYRALHLPLLWFALHHTEYEYFWNWEMDVRYTGNWYNFFQALSRFADKQPRKGLWERNARFYIPSVHGTWENFSSSVENAGDEPVWGPLRSPETPELETDDIPPTSYSKDDYTWGVGDPADLITLNPIFNPDGTLWNLHNDVTGYDREKEIPPRRAAIVNAVRFSRRLLKTMHQESSTYAHSMFTEMFPASMALHHGLKAVYVPHPVFINRAWPLDYLVKVYNGGPNGASGGSEDSIFGPREHNFKGSSWYYHAEFPAKLWKRWIGLSVDEEGGFKAEARAGSEGRMCLPGILLHPVKDVRLPS